MKDATELESLQYENLLLKARVKKLEADLLRERKWADYGLGKQWSLRVSHLSADNRELLAENIKLREQIAQLNPE